MVDNIFSCAYILEVFTFCYVSSVRVEYQIDSNLCLAVLGNGLSPPLR